MHLTAPLLRKYQLGLQAAPRPFLPLSAVEQFGEIAGMVRMDVTPRCGESWEQVHFPILCTNQTLMMH